MSMYYNLDKLYSRDFLLGFVIGARGRGKSFASKLFLLKRFIKTGEQFIYLRRYKTELDMALVTFWDDLQANGYFDDLDLRVKKSKLLTTFTVDGEVCGYAVPLSTANILKSTAFPKVSTILFDEFLLDARSGTYKYLKREVDILLDVIETVGRMHDIKVILLGNNIAPHSSPYFAYWNLELPEDGKEFRTFNDGAIVIDYVPNSEEFLEAKNKTKFGKLISSSEYGRYAIGNEALRENNSFIRVRPSKSTFYTVLVINGLTLGLWRGSDGYLYLSEKYDPNNSSKFVFDFDSHTEGTIFEGARENMYIGLMVKAYKQGWLMFESQKVKSMSLMLLNKCIAS